jgi:hypothetical protein
VSDERVNEERDLGRHARPGEWTPPTERADRRWNRAMRAALGLAIALHLLILVSMRESTLPQVSMSAAGPQVGDYRAAEGGGGGMEMLRVRERVEAATPEEEPVPEVEPVPDVEVEIEPVPEPEPLADRIPEVAITAPGLGDRGVGEGTADRTGPGRDDGRGQGGGGTEMEGASGLAAPVPRGLFLPPQGVPSDARGREITVYVFVTAHGRVVSDSTRIHPPTRDSRFNRRLRDQAAEWVFEPA